MSACLSGLPPEVLLEIAQSLDVRSAIHLLQTCKRLSFLSGFRSFWVEKLQIFAQEHHLPHKTFDIPSMTTTQVRAALSRPYRFEHDLKARKFSKRTPLQLSHSHSSTWAAGVIPGGRWLVTVSYEVIGRPVLQVFDITPPTASNFKAVATLSVDCTKDVKLQIDPRPDGAVICVSTFRAEEEPPETAFLVFKFKETDLTLGPFTEIAFEDLPSDSLLCGDVLAIAFDDACICAWRWAEEVEESLQAGNQSTVTYICSLGNDAISCWCPGDDYLTVHGPVRGGSSDQFSEPIDHDGSTRQLDMLSTPGFNTSGLPRAELEHKPIDVFHVPGTTSISPSLFVIRESCATLLIPPDLSSDQPILNVMQNTNYTYDDLFSNTTKRPRIARRTINGHLITISEDNELCIFDASEDRVDLQELFMDAPRSMVGKQHPFMCPAAGVLGSVSGRGTLYIWRTN